MSKKQFIKAADTVTPVSKSQRDIETILRRYGATDFSFGSSWERRIARIAFRVPDTLDSAIMVPVRLEISMQEIAERLFGKEELNNPQQRWIPRRGYVTPDPAKMYEQAERVAWRHLVLWVDAACAAASAGLQTMSEAFLAHTLVRGHDGEVRRVVEMLDQAAVADGKSGYRAMLPERTS